MIYTELTIRAMKVAYEAHHGQVDQTGVPYIFHPMHVAEQMTDEVSCCAALLHDVVEDTSLTMDELTDMFPPAVTRVVRLLTHEVGVPYLDYVRAVARDPVARLVKLADLEHNADQTRFAGCGVPQERLAYFREKYAAARAILDEADDGGDV